jgi:hypoxanthine phosphoribosyltransferase
MEVLISAEQIQARVHELAQEIQQRFAGQPVTVVGVLTGSLIFLADLIRKLDLPIQISLIQASSYRGASTTAGQLLIKDELLNNITKRHVLLLDDILDTGQTISLIKEHLLKRGADSVLTAVLLRKIGRQVIPFEPEWCGFTIPDRFVVGYGLDFNDEYRHLPFIGVLPDPVPGH